MKINFIYNEDKDIDCLLSKGGGSNNSPGSKTKTYEALLQYTSDLTNKEKVRQFVREYIQKNNININANTELLKTNWDKVAVDFERRAEKVFGVNISDEVTAYLTITGRFPYNTEARYFYVSAKKTNANSTAMHELWHFYTWLRFGKYESNLGSKIYNDFKESLTVLLNLECADLLGGEVDTGYPQHQETRKRIADKWSKEKNIDSIWSSLCEDLENTQNVK